MSQFCSLGQRRLKDRRTTSNEGNGKDDDVRDRKRNLRKEELPKPAPVSKKQTSVRSKTTARQTPDDESVVAD